jgi:hypothetical protein
MSKETTMKSIAAPLRLSEVEVPAEEKRVSTGIAGLDECLAESDDSKPGLPLGVSVLLSGMPGGGKSTIATYMAAATGGADGESLYGHGEERAISVRKRWDRLSLKGVDPWLVPLKSTETFLEHVRDLQVERNLTMVVVDSVQTLTLDGKRRHEHQFEGAEMICGQVTSNGGSVVFVNHVSKSGDTHAGAGGLSHMVDVHIHVTVNAKKGERLLEIRKNRFGRAGFQVQLYIGHGSLSVGTPAPIAMNMNGGGGSNTAHDRAADAAQALLMQRDPRTNQGRFLTGYDFDSAPMGVSAGAWRVGLELAARRLVRDGFEVLQEKRQGRTGYYMPNPPEMANGANGIIVPAPIILPAPEIVVPE